MAFLRVASPCNETWSAMTPAPSGRHCSRCERKVDDLRRVTAAHAHAYALLFASRGLCGRINVDQDGVPVFHEPARSTAGARLPVLAAAMTIGVGCGSSSAEVHDPTCAPVARIVSLPLPLPPAAGPMVDSDQDGIADVRDHCPHSAAATTDGCTLPDADRDGVADAQDGCPQEPGAPPSGCPPRVIVTTMGDLQIMQYVHFRPGSAVLNREDLVVLDETAKIIRAHPELKHIVIEGHTDAAEKNASALSLRRAKAAVDYLINKGADATVLDPQGQGATKPIDDNATPDGRQRNRRVEFRVVDP